LPGISVQTTALCGRSYRLRSALADIYRDATAVIDAVGWDHRTAPRDTGVEVPLTAGHVQQLHERRCDLLNTNLDLLTDIGADRQINDLVMADIHANRRSVEAINDILDSYSTAVTG
jgi:hypothetical protein